MQFISVVEGRASELGGEPAQSRAGCMGAGAACGAERRFTGDDEGGRAREERGGERERAIVRAYVSVRV